ncbi:MAG: nuclear transport factor 2 family protein [Gloeobacteraceae cyanobacterium ES-bin-144]|nr:nuclear transport factor 2 family protein [Verrucomicrobiales bacterium]
MTLHCPDSMSTMVGFFNGFSPVKLENMGDVYSPDIEFHDPTNHTRGLAALRKVYENIFKEFENITVSVIDAHGDDHTGFLLWTMHSTLRGKEFFLSATSHLKFAPDGRVIVQRNHWDASLLNRNKIPLIGWAVDGIKRLAK